MLSAMAANTINQTSWTIKTRHEDQTLLDSHIYRKITHKSFPEATKFDA